MSGDKIITTTNTGIFVNNEWTTDFDNKLIIWDFTLQFLISRTLLNKSRLYQAKLVLLLAINTDIYESGILAFQAL